MLHTPIPLATRRATCGALLAALAALAGCTSSAVPYRPDRAVVRSIPREKAQAELRARLARATASSFLMGSDDPIVPVSVGDDDLVFRTTSDPMWSGAPKDYRFRYAALDPHAYRYPSRGDAVCLKLDGEYGNPVRLANINDGCIWFPGAEDAEVCIDALESLKAEAAARAGGPR
jgi:hypothetical protein